MSPGAPNVVQFRAPDDNGSLVVSTPSGNSQPIRISTETGTVLPDRPKSIAFEPEDDSLPDPLNAEESAVSRGGERGNGCAEQEGR